MKMKRFLMLICFFVLFIAFGTITAAAQETELPYIIKDGTTYYESSYDFGSGRNAVVNAENIYTTIPCYAGINGYSFLDEEGRVIDSEYQEESNDICVPEAPKGTVETFLHFKTLNYRNGWINSESVISKNTNAEEEINLNEDIAKPEEVVEEIKTHTKKDKKTAIVIDYSGSMSEHQQKVVELLATLSFDENTTIIVFGTTYQVITTTQLSNGEFDVGAGTHMYQALNKATSLEVEQLIIISDLCTYEDVMLKPSEYLENVIIYDPLGIDDIVVRELKETWKAKIKRTIIG